MASSNYICSRRITPASMPRVASPKGVRSRHSTRRFGISPNSSASDCMNSSCSTCRRRARGAAPVARFGLSCSTPKGRSTFHSEGIAGVLAGKRTSPSTSRWIRSRRASSVRWVLATERVATAFAPRNAMGIAKSLGRACPRRRRVPLRLRPSCRRGASLRPRRSAVRPFHRRRDSLRISPCAVQLDSSC